MSDYVSNATLAGLATEMLDARHVSLVTHSKPDGDALGSVLALGRELRHRGVSVDILLHGPLEPGMREIIGDTTVTMLGGAVADRPVDEHDLIVVVDTGAWSQLDGVKDWVRRHHDRVVGVDHHACGDHVAARRFVDTSAASTTQILLRLMDEIGHRLSGENGGVAKALFLGLATDTGWFRFPNADAATFAAASRLLAAGIDKDRMFRLTEEQHGPSRLALTARALASIRYERDGTVAIMTLGTDDFHETHGCSEELTSLVNAPMAVGAVQVSILLTQTMAGRTKISFRSKPADDPADEVDVNVLAGRFGGGGHVRAAGARVEMDLAEALEAIVVAVR